MLCHIFHTIINNIWKGSCVCFQFLVRQQARYGRIHIIRSRYRHSKTSNRIPVYFRKKKISAHSIIRLSKRTRPSCPRVGSCIFKKGRPCLSDCEKIKHDYDTAPKRFGIWKMYPKIYRMCHKSDLADVRKAGCFAYSKKVFAMFKLNGSKLID